MRGSLHGRSRDKFVLFDLSLGERRMLMEQEQEAYRSINEENNADAEPSLNDCENTIRKDVGRKSVTPVKKAFSNLKISVLATFAELRAVYFTRDGWNVQKEKDEAGPPVAEPPVAGPPVAEPPVENQDGSTFEHAQVSSEPCARHSPFLDRSKISELGLAEGIVSDSDLTVSVRKDQLEGLCRGYPIHHSSPKTRADSVPTRSTSCNSNCQVSADHNPSTLTMRSAILSEVVKYCLGLLLFLHAFPLSDAKTVAVSADYQNASDQPQHSKVDVVDWFTFWGLCISNVSFQNACCILVTCVIVVVISALLFFKCGRFRREHVVQYAESVQECSTNRSTRLSFASHTNDKLRPPSSLNDRPPPTLNGSPPSSLNGRPPSSLNGRPPPTLNGRPPPILNSTPPPISNDTPPPSSSSKPPPSPNGRPLSSSNFHCSEKTCNVKTFICVMEQSSVGNPLEFYNIVAAISISNGGRKQLDGVVGAGSAGGDFRKSNCQSSCFDMKVTPFVSLAGDQADSDNSPICMSY